MAEKQQDALCMARFYVPERMLGELQEMARENHRSFSGEIRKMCAEYLDKARPKKAARV